MRLQVLDEAVRFSCGSCTFCCDQPWRTMIEIARAEALDRHDFSTYPQLSGKRFYRKAGDGRDGYYELAKGEGTKCLFLDRDGLCIIHKELGPKAKPRMCRQFPFLSARTWVEDRVSVNFGCPAVQQSRGKTLQQQESEVAGVIHVSERPAKPEAPVVFDLRRRITQAENEAILERALKLFQERQAQDVWMPFAELLTLLAAVQSHLMQQAESAGSNGLLDLLRSDGPLPGTAARPQIRVFPHASVAPMPVRVLFAATLFPDTLPADAGCGMGFLRRLTLIPKLLTLSTMSGSYASRLLGRNVSMTKVLQHDIEETLDPAATALLLCYYRSRFWQRMMVGTKLPFVAGVHQHIHDLNAILFLARAEAAEKGAKLLDEVVIRQALTMVEFHLANQVRLYDHTLKGWLRGRLCDLDLAARSLRLMALKPSEAPVEIDARHPPEAERG